MNHNKLSAFKLFSDRLLRTDGFSLAPPTTTASLGTADIPATAAGRRVRPAAVDVIPREGGTHSLPGHAGRAACDELRRALADAAVVEPRGWLTNLLDRLQALVALAQRGGWAGAAVALGIEAQRRFADERRETLAAASDRAGRAGALACCVGHQRRTAGVWPHAIIASPDGALRTGANAGRVLDERRFACLRAHALTLLQSRSSRADAACGGRIGH